MNILVDMRVLATGFQTGVEWYTASLTSALLKLNTRDQYRFFFNRFRKRILPREYDELLAKAPIEDWRIPSKILDASLRFTGEPKVDRCIKTDLVWSPHSYILRTTARTPHVVTTHDLSWVHYAKFFSLRKRLWHWIQDIQGEARRADRLIAVSEYTRQDVIKTFGVPPESIVTVHSGMDARYRPRAVDDPALRTFAKVHGLEHPFILFVGTLEPRKNLPALIEAFDRLKGDSVHRNLSLVLVGRPGWLYDSVERALAASRYRADIRLWGVATTEELQELYPLARVFVYPSFFEGFGFPVLEAQACGTPVVASNTSSLPEILGESALLVDPNDREALTDAVRRALEDASLRKTFREKGFENVKRFSWERAAAETLKVFKDAYAR